MRLPFAPRTVRHAVRAYRAAGKPPKGDSCDSIAWAAWVAQSGAGIPARSLRRVVAIARLLAGETPHRRLLMRHLAQHGPIRTARVSAAQARGRAKQYPYWGAARGEIRLTHAGWPSNVPTERASSDRRSQGLAGADCEEICQREGRLYWRSIGVLTEEECREVVRNLGIRIPAGLAVATALAKERA